MDRVEKFFSLLKAVTVDCKDDGTQFILPDRIEAIESLLVNCHLTVLFAYILPSKADTYTADFIFRGHGSSLQEGDYQGILLAVADGVGGE